MARPKNQGETERLEFSVPAGLYEYLTMHARKAIIGASQNEVARFLLVTYGTQLMKDGYLGIEYPPKGSE